MNKRVYGIIGISSFMSNWNADFTGFPKTTTSGDIFGSDKALKFTMKKMWDEEGEKVLYLKSLIEDTKKDNKKDEETKTKIIPRTLVERYSFIFNEKPMPEDAKEVLKDLFSLVDVKNFGATFAEKKMNLSITGAVQIGQGMNLYKEAQVQEQTILSPFRNSAKERVPSDSGDEKAAASTLGTKIITDEAHYFYPFVINPLAYRDFVGMGVSDGYTDDDYAFFKKAAISSATAYSSNSKVNCDNEFALFVETDQTLYLPTLTNYIRFEKDVDDEKNLIEFTNPKIFEKTGVQKVLVYYNSATTEIKGFDCNEKTEYFDIVLG